MELKKLLEVVNVGVAVEVRKPGGEVLVTEDGILAALDKAPAGLRVQCVTPHQGKIVVTVDEEDEQPDPRVAQLLGAMAIMKRERDQLAEEYRDMKRKLKTAAADPETPEGFAAILAEMSEKYAAHVRVAIMASAGKWREDKTAAALIRAWKAAVDGGRRDMIFAAGDYERGEEGDGNIKLSEYKRTEAGNLLEAIYTVLIRPAAQAAEAGKEGQT